MMIQRLDIPKRDRRCTAGDHVFTPGDECFTFISLEKNRWNRKDLCKSCWSNLKVNGLPLNVMSYWQSKIPSIKENLPPIPLQRDERALSLLKSMMTSEDIQAAKEAYILALYLLRKKRLSLRQEIDQLGQSLLLFEIVETEELLPVKKISLESHEIEILQKSISDKLSPKNA